ncbi:MAG: SdpI family protein [Actinomycetota bacterium]
MSVAHGTAAMLLLSAATAENGGGGQSPTAMPWAVAWGLAAVHVAAGLLLVGIGRRSSRGILGRNHLVGIRTRTTLASDEAWAAGHRAGGPLTVAGGWAYVATGLALVPAGAFPGWVAVAVIITGTAVLLGCCVGAVVVANRAARKESTGLD